MKKLAFVVLYLLSSISYSAGNVHIVKDGVTEKTKLWAITMCGKPMMYVYNQYGSTKIVYLYKAGPKNISQIKKRFMKLPGYGNRRTITVLKYPCPISENGIET